MAPTLTNYEYIAVTLCLMSIAILRRRLRDRARVGRRATRSWFLIERQDTKLREAISATERLAVTLRFLATDFPFPAFLLPCAFVL
jgi:hypothetical protein